MRETWCTCWMNRKECPLSVFQHLEKVVNYSIYMRIFVNFFRGVGVAPMAYGCSQARSRIWVGSCWAIPQPQQCGIQAVSATYITAHSNARYLTYWARPGIEPASSQIPVELVNAEPWSELPDGVSEDSHYPFWIRGAGLIVVTHWPQQFNVTM